jgi:hypothetical protein
MSAEIRALWFDAMRRAFVKIDKLDLGELLLLANNFSGDQFAADCERDEDGFAICPAYTFAAKSYVFDF